jgi:hypothetical protein
MGLVQLSTALFDWIEAFYSSTRRHSALGKVSPTEVERRHTNTTTAAKISYRWVTLRGTRQFHERHRDHPGRPPRRRRRDAGL